MRRVLFIIPLAPFGESHSFRTSIANTAAHNTVTYGVVKLTPYANS